MVLGALGAGALGGAGINIVITAVDNFSKTFGRINKSMLLAGAAITALGVVGVGVMKKFIDTSISFESAFAGVRKTVELTEVEFADLNQRFKDMSTTIPVTFEELSRIGEIAGQLGVEGVDNISKFTRTIADIAVTTNLTSEVAATAFARIANVMGEPISNVDRMGSAIVDLGNNFATSESEIVAMTMRIMGAGKTIGLNTQEVFGMSAALSALGIRSEMGGSAISRAMITIAKSVSEGGDKLRKYAEVSGMTIEEFSEAWKDKPVEAMSKVIMGLKNITDTGGNTFGVLADLDLKSIRITDTMLRLAGSEDGITKAVDRSNIAWEENTALTIEAEKRYATLESQLKVLKNKFSVIAEAIGNNLTPILEVLIDKLEIFLDYLKEHPKLTKFAAVALAVGSALALIIGPAFILIAVLPMIAAGFGLVTAAGTPLWLIALAIIAAIALLIGIGYLLVKNWDWISEKAKLLYKFLKDYFAPEIAILKFTLKALGLMFVWLWDHGIGWIWDKMKLFYAWVKDKFLWVLEKAISLLGKVAGRRAEMGAQIGSASERILGSKKSGGYISETGPYLLHKGEYVVPTNETGGKSLTINISDNNIYGTDPNEIAIALQEKLNESITT